MAVKKTVPKLIELTAEEMHLGRDFIAIHLQQAEIDAQLAALKPALVAVLKAKGNFTVDGHTIKLKRRKSWKYDGEIKGLMARIKDVMKFQQEAGLAKSTLTEFPEVEPLPPESQPKASKKPGLLSKLMTKVK